MFNCNLIVLSYHRFNESESEYPFSRTYKQFAHDLISKDFDFLTIDDGHKSIIKACEMMREKNIRAKLFISTSLVGEKGYCTWEEIWKLSKYHDIENHSHDHVRLTECSETEVINNLKKANDIIQQEIWTRPRYFVPPYNNFNENIELIASKLGMQLIKKRVEIRNNSR